MHSAGAIMASHTYTHAKQTISSTRGTECQGIGSTCSLSLSPSLPSLSAASLSLSGSVKPRVGVLDDAPGARLLDGPVGLQAHGAVLHVELLEAPAPGRHLPDPPVGDHVAAPDGELPQARAVPPQGGQPDVRDVALADVERPEPGAARAGQQLDRVVRDGLAAADVQVAELVAVPGDGPDPDVGDPGALGGREIAEVRTEAGELH